MALAKSHSEEQGGEARSEAGRPGGRADTPQGAARVSERLAPLVKRPGTSGGLAFTLGDYYSRCEWHCLVGEERGGSGSRQSGSGREPASPPEEFALLCDRGCNQCRENREEMPFGHF